MNNKQMKHKPIIMNYGMFETEIQPAKKKHPKASPVKGKTDKTTTVQPTHGI